MDAADPDTPVPPDAPVVVVPPSRRTLAQTVHLALAVAAAIAMLLTHPHLGIAYIAPCVGFLVALRSLRGSGSQRTKIFDRHGFRTTAPASATAVPWEIVRQITVRPGELVASLPDRTVVLAVDRTEDVRAILALVPRSIAVVRDLPRGGAPFPASYAIVWLLVAAAVYDVCATLGAFR